MANKLSCGVLIFNEHGNLLAAHSTGKAWKPGTWDIPKGMSDKEDENELETAVREVQEETGLDLNQQKSKFEDLGRHEYVNGKDIYLFRYDSPDFDDGVASLKCTTYFTRDDKEYPEVNGFKWVEPSKIEKYLFPSLYNVVKELI